MAIQVLPILKALAPVIATAGNMFTEWQRNKRREREPQSDSAEPQTEELLQRIQAIHEASAQNSHLIAQVAEQLQQTAIQIEQGSGVADAKYQAVKKLAMVGIALNIVALSLILYLLVR